MFSVDIATRAMVVQGSHRQGKSGKTEKEIPGLEKSGEFKNSGNIFLNVDQ
jgi:hypothetical protein